MHTTTDERHQPHAYVKWTLRIGLGIFALAACEAAAAGPAAPMPETLTLNLQERCPDVGKAGKDAKKVVNFSHKRHAAEYLPGNAAYSATPYTDAFTCVACHAGAEKPEAIQAGAACGRVEAGTPDVKKTYHGLCLDCHKNMAKAGKKTGPESCKECHERS